jgi:endogenous inhibitor of DNA gyrase (YacG/DUF329 family)
MSCPYCGKTTDPLFRPFCSKRCKELDLARWLNEDYRVPVVEEDPLDDEQDAENPKED